MRNHAWLNTLRNAMDVGLVVFIGQSFSLLLTAAAAFQGLPRRTNALLLVVVVAMSAGNTLRAQQDDAFGDLKPGDQAFAWSELPGVDEQTHSLADLADQDVVIVCFTSNSCPYSVDYEDRMIALQARYLDAGQKVVLVAINANSVKADELQAMKTRATEKRFNFAYLKDESQSVAKSYGALYTPEFFVLNKDRKIVFRGAMDDQTDAAKVTRNYVELAVQAAMAGKMPSTTEVPARGCAVRYKRVRR